MGGLGEYGLYYPSREKAATARQAEVLGSWLFGGAGSRSKAFIIICFYLSERVEEVSRFMKPDFILEPNFSQSMVAAWDPQ